MQYYYQSGSLYRLRALGERRTMDITVGMSTALTSHSLLACTTRSAIRRHQPAQRTVLGQVDCFIQCEVVGSQITLDGVQPHDTRTSLWSLPVFAGSLVTSSRQPGRLHERPDDRTWNVGVAVRTADGSRRTADAGDKQCLRCGTIFQLELVNSCVHACIPAGLPVSLAAPGSTVVFDATDNGSCGNGSGVITRTFVSVHT